MYFFEDKEKEKELKIILDEWKNTPFRHKCGVKGLGCDCVHFGIRVFEEFGLIDLTKVKLPDYPRDWHLHNTREALQEALLQYMNVVEVDLNGELMNGDIILSHYGNASSHVGIFYDDHVYQSIVKVGVKCIHFNDKKFRSYMKFAYRVKE